ncbi:2-hydroxyacid dehydrogenase [Thalassobaculum litoreum]|uniref:Glyoxylate/hydroxypyruvate reductase A n=1 Tax=Thalassobaculum litoreum DSM 18839 TaxID=1123362 RepID=A0A8G2BGG4_9PROT|nr:glyoxylate/hydroxypyruvate reductase A [Thalassobaculum litoreum]SDF55199.1 glyoxylate/hydroxypyruvate reductase A [Thalassobaculum litoreum DSM 18839]
MPAVLFRTDNDNPDQWREALAKRIPDLDFRVWPDVGNKEDIEFALVWKVPAGAYDGMTNLKAICSLGQGVDHIFAEPNLPEGAQILRIVDPWMAQAMAEWVLLQVLRFHRQGMEYEQFQREGRWVKLPAPETATKRVGILGMGALGAQAATTIAALGFDVAGWSRTRKEIAGVTSFAGEAEFDAFLARTDILCCLLPLTPETTDIIDAETLAKLPKGAFVVNSGRGAQLVEEDLLAALDSGHIAGASLDVFRTEPLPEGHPFWTHPKVQVWPHVSAQTNAESGADQVAENIRRIFAGETPNNVVSRERKY